jgi:ligand-binding sensor domain-containing protein
MKTTIYAPLAVISNPNATVINLTKVPFAIENTFEFNTVSMNLWNRIYRKQESVSSCPEVNSWSLNFISTALFRKFSMTIVLVLFSLISFSKVTMNDAVKFVDANSKITAVAESEKFLWIGTNNGVVRVTKKNEKTVYLTVSNSKLPSNYITSICVRKDGNVWIGTANGILRYDKFAYIVVNSDNSPLRENYITSIVEDKHNDLWVGTAHSGLMKVHNLSYQVFNQKNSLLKTDGITSLTIDENGNLFVNR